MRKQLKRAISSLLVFAMAFGVSVSSAGHVEAAKKPKLSSSKVTVKVGKTKTVKVKNTSKKVKWSIKSGKKNIALKKVKKTSVTIQGKKAGTATVVAAVSGKKLSCKVTVKKAPDTKPEETEQPTAAPVGTEKPSETALPPQNTAEASTAPSDESTEKPLETATPTETPVPYATPGPDEFEGTDISWIDPMKPMVAFTFDDGPIGNADTDNSMIIQNSLREHGAHATFFYIGSQINSDGKEKEIKQAVDWGFEVGNHSDGWDSMTGKKFTEEVIRESIDATDAKLTEITGYKNFLFRPPNLAVNKTMQETIEKPFINCARDSQDWNNATEEQIIANVQKAVDGDVILMHETQNNTAAVIDQLLDYFQEKDWQVVSVSEMFLVRGVKMENGTVYNNCPPPADAQAE